MIAYYYPPINSGGSVRPLKMAKYLRSRGHRVWILTHTYSGEHAGEEQTIRILDISFNRRRRGIRKVVWFVLRLWGELMNRMGRYQSIYGWWKKKVMAHSDDIVGQSKPDLILVTYPPVETLELGYHFSMTYRLPLVTDFRDGLLFESIEKKHMERFPAIHRRYTELEEKVVRRSTAVITINRAIGAYFTRFYPGTRVEIVANGFDADDFTGLAPFPDLQKGRFNLVHAGRFSLSDGSIDVAPFFRAVSALCVSQPELTRRLTIHLAGQLSRGEKKIILPLTRGGVVKYYGLLSRRQSLALQMGADLLLIVTHPQRSSAVSAKIFEYLYSGKPILALTGATAVAEIIRETGTGMIVDPLDEKAIKEGLAHYLYQREPKPATQFKQKAIDQYSMEVQMARLDRIIKDMENGDDG